MSIYDDQFTSSQDFRIAWAEAFIQDTYGSPVSVERKKKLLDKWGYNPTLDTADGQVTVSATGTNETLQTSNSITHIVGGSGDTHTVFVEGHYLDASGNLIFYVQSKALTSTTPVALTQPLARASRAYVPQGGAPTGPITVTIGSGGTVVLTIIAGEVQSEKCQTSLSYRDFWIIENYGAAVLTSNNASVSFQLQFRPLFAPDGTAYTNPNWRPVTRRWLLGNGGRAQFPQETPIIIPSNSDVRIIASTTANSTQVTAHIDGYLAIDLGLADAADPDPA